MKPLLGKLPDGKPVPMVEPDCLEERIKRELMSLGLCDETEVSQPLYEPGTKNVSLIGQNKA